MTTSRPARVWAEVTGGDALGRGHQPALSWWLPDGSSVQHAYQVRTDDGFDTDRGESEWSDPVALESGLLGEADWTAAG
jgi:hypothetical protein